MPDGPTKLPRFPYIAALLCVACIGAAAWTWMRYSYAWPIEPGPLDEAVYEGFARWSLTAGPDSPPPRGGAVWHFRYVELLAPAGEARPRDIRVDPTEPGYPAVLYFDSTRIAVSADLASVNSLASGKSWLGRVLMSSDVRTYVDTRFSR
ncbi:MAG: hypothetical protein ACYSU0_19605, partial [Planctomycetota bacterium]